MINNAIKSIEILAVRSRHVGRINTHVKIDDIRQYISIIDNKTIEKKILTV